MKKLMIAAAIVCAAAMSQAAAMSWGTGTLYMVKEDGTWNTAKTMFAGTSDIKSFALTAYLYDTDGETLLATATKSAAPTAPTSALSGTFSNGSTTDLVKNDKTYFVKLVMSADFGDGTQTFLNTDTVGIYVDKTGDGSANFTTLGVINTGSTQWSAVPEPTSGLLLLLGVAGLALRRRRA